MISCGGLFQSDYETLVRNIFVLEEETASMTPATPQVDMDKEFMMKKVYTYITKKTTYRQTNQASIIIVIVVEVIVVLVVTLRHSQIYKC